MASLLEKSANALLIVACTVVVGEYGYRLIPKPVQHYRLFSPGQHIQGTATLALSNAPRTLIIATSSTCQYCNASMPFYKRVADVARNTRTRIVAVTGEDAKVNRTFLASHGIGVETVLSQPESGVQIPVVPSLILVKGDGTVIDSWSGRPTDASYERLVIEAIAKV